MPRRSALALAPLLLAGCGDDGPSWGAPDPASAEGTQIRDLWQVFVVAGIAVAAVVYALLVFALVRYRRRDDVVPGQRADNVRLEILYTAVPIALVGLLFGLSTAVEQDITHGADDPAVVVEVVGFQWQWRFAYPKEGIELIGTPEDGPPELVLPVGEQVRFELHADDVAHSFWVPSFLEKRDLIPGVENTVGITPTRTGTFVGRCAEFCGLDHWRMGFTVRVVERAAFDAWVEDRQEQELAGA